MFVCCHWLNACGWVGVSLFLSFSPSVSDSRCIYMKTIYMQWLCSSTETTASAWQRNGIKWARQKLSWFFQRAENEWLKTANTPINIGWWKKKMCTHSQTQIQTHVHTCIPLNEATTVRWHNIKANKTAEPKRMRGDEKKMHRQSFNRKICSGYGSDSRQLDRQRVKNEW